MMTRSRFNRNIVECKGEGQGAVRQMDADLIETLWNVKLSPPALRPAARAGFNRNIVECKDHSKRVYWRHACEI